MARANIDRALTVMGGLTIFLVWGVVMLYKGTLEAMLRGAWYGGFEDGTPIQKHYTGILPLDFPFRILMTMFAGISHLGFVSGYLMLAELVVMILVFNMVAIVESRRADGSSMLRL